MVTSELLWHPDAILDAEAARNWYAERSPLAARGFLLALSDAVEAVVAAPNRWPEKSDGCRYYHFTSRYPFTLVYRTASKFEVVAVAHQLRKPGFWNRRT